MELTRNNKLTYIVAFFFGYFHNCITIHVFTNLKFTIHSSERKSSFFYLFSTDIWPAVFQWNVSKFTKSECLNHGQEEGQVDG